MSVATILIADDSTEVFDSLNAALSPHYWLTYALNGAVALKLARLLRPELIISEVALRVLDGIELLREVRRDPEISGTPVILWSAYHRPPEIRDFAKGCDPVVVLDKSSDLQDLFAIANHLLDSKEADRSRVS